MSCAIPETQPIAENGCSFRRRYDLSHRGGHMLETVNHGGHAAAVAGEDRNTSCREYLATTLGTEEYGIDILRVQEIRGYETVTRIANAPAFIKGVINL